MQTGITRIRGQWQRLDMLGGIPVMPTFHPAYVLRQYTQEVRRAVWSDLVAAKKWLDEAGTGDRENPWQTGPNSMRIVHAPDQRASSSPSSPSC